MFQPQVSQLSAAAQVDPDLAVEVVLKLAGFTYRSMARDFFLHALFPLYGGRLLIFYDLLWCIVDVCVAQRTIKVLMTVDNRRGHFFNIHICNILSSHRQALHIPSLCLFCNFWWIFVIFSQVPAKCLKSKLSVKRAISHHPPGDPARWEHGSYRGTGWKSSLRFA